MPMAVFCVLSASAVLPRWAVAVTTVAVSIGGARSSVMFCSTVLSAASMMPVTVFGVVADQARLKRDRAGRNTRES